MAPSGCYTADLIVNGETVRRKSFFPASWTRKEVISAIYEAYDHALHSGAIELRSDGKYLLRGLSKEGVKIEMYITKKGWLTTVYPLTGA